MSDRVKKLLLVSLSFGTTVVLIGLSAWWVPTLYDDKPTASFTWASEPEDTDGSTSGGSYAGGNGLSGDNNDSTTESPGPVESGDSGNQGGSGGTAGNSEAGANGEQGGNGGSANGPASGSGNKPGSSGGNVTSSKPGKPATSSGSGSGGSGSSGGENSGTAGGEDGGPLTHEEKGWFHNDLTDEQNAVALKCARRLMGDYKSKTPIATIKSVFLSMRGSGDKPHDNSPKYREAYDYACGHINEVTQIKMLGLVLDILGVEWKPLTRGWITGTSGSIFIVTEQDITPISSSPG